MWSAWQNSLVCGEAVLQVVQLSLSVGEGVVKTGVGLLVREGKVPDVEDGEYGGNASFTKHPLCLGNCLTEVSGVLVLIPLDKSLVGYSLRVMEGLPPLPLKLGCEIGGPTPRESRQTQFNLCGGRLQGTVLLVGVLGGVDTLQVRVVVVWPRFPRGWVCPRGGSGQNDLRRGKNWRSCLSRIKSSIHSMRSRQRVLGFRV